MTTTETTLMVAPAPATSRSATTTLATAFAADAIAYGFVLYSSGALMISLTAHYSATRFYVSLAFSLCAATAGVSSLLLGPLLDRGLVRRIMILGSVVFSAGFALVSFTRSLPLLLLCFGALLGPGSAMISQSASAKLIATRFQQNRGRALTIASVGVTLSGIVMPVLATYMLQRWSVDEVLRIYAFVAFALLLPLTLAIERPPTDRAPAAGPAAAVQKWSYRALLADARFVKLAVVFGLGFCVIVIVLVHTLPRVIDSGAVGVQAAYVGAAIALLGLPAKLTLSRLADTARLELIFCVAVLTQALGLAVFLQSTGLTGNLLGAAIFGVGMGITQPSLAIFVVRIFGAESVGAVMGLLAPFIYCIQLVGVPLAGRAFDKLGNYDVVMGGCIAALVLVAAIAWSLRAELAGKQT